MTAAAARSVRAAARGDADPRGAGAHPRRAARRAGRRRRHCARRPRARPWWRWRGPRWHEDRAAEAQHGDDHARRVELDARHRPPAQPPRRGRGRRPASGRPARPPRPPSASSTFADLGSAVVLAPTTDRARIGAALDRLGQTREGTALGEAVSVALGALSTAGAIAGTPRPPTRPTPLAGCSCSRTAPTPSGARRAPTRRPSRPPSAAGVPLYTILLGNDPGRPDQPLPAETLSSMATRTGGIFAQSTTSADLQAVFADIGSIVTPTAVLRELTVWVAGLAVALLALAAGLGALSRPRRRGRAGARRARPIGRRAPRPGPRRPRGAARPGRNGRRRGGAPGAAVGVDRLASRPEPESPSATLQVKVMAALSARTVFPRRLRRINLRGVG